MCINNFVHVMCINNFVHVMCIFMKIQKVCKFIIFHKKINISFSILLFLLLFITGVIIETLQIKTSLINIELN